MRIFAARQNRKKFWGHLKQRILNKELLIKASNISGIGSEEQSRT